MRTDRIIKRLEPCRVTQPLKRWGAFASDQRIGAPRMIKLAGNRFRQKCGLVIPPFEQPRPMQRNRHDQSILGDDTAHYIRHPKPCRAGHFLSVAMLKRENQLAPRIAVHQRGTALQPWLGRSHTGVAMMHAPLPTRRQRSTATITNHATQKLRVAPTGATKPEIAFHHIAAGDAARRIDEGNCGLKLRQHQPMYPL